MQECAARTRCLSRFKWISSATVLYIGKASSLQKRLKQYMDYGSGKPVGHQGGRYIWQLGDSSRLQLFWKTTLDHDPAVVENELIRAFHKQYGRLPFANLRFHKLVEAEA